MSKHCQSSFFQLTQTQVSSTVVQSQLYEPIWYTDMPIKYNKFTRFMHDMSKYLESFITCTPHY